MKIKFIKKIAVYVQKYAPRYGIKVHSPIIAQAILESTFGTSELAVNCNNFFGLKYNPKQPNRCPSSNGYYVKKGSEQNLDGSYTSSTMLWQKFDSMEDCVIGYFDFINISRYSNLKGVTDPKVYLENIKADGYATSINYVSNILRVIDNYNLTQYDNNNEKEQVNKMRINVHAGHNPDGKVACGAIGFIKESTENRNVKNEVCRLLRLLGHTVYDCTYDNGTNEKNVLANNVALCNAHEVDLDVSIHFNSVAKTLKEDGKTTGVEVYVYKPTSKAKPYAEKTCNAIAELGFKNRGVKTANFYVLRNTKAPAMLIECCFVNDKDDVELYDCKSMAEAIVYGITGHRYNEPVNDKTDDDINLKDEEVSGDKNALYRVQVGAYGVKANAEAMKKKLEKAGFDAIIVKS